MPQPATPARRVQLFERGARLYYKALYGDSKDVDIYKSALDMLRQKLIESAQASKEEKVRGQLAALEDQVESDVRLHRSMERIRNDIAGNLL